MSMRYPAGFISAFYNPLENPNPPTIGTATAGNGQISITFTAPTVVGGSAITGFIATAKRTSDGVLFSNSGASSPIVVTGLTAVAFTVTVVAVNTYGPSASSAASNSVTPLPSIGDAYEGGFFAGQIGVSSVATHNLVVGPAASAQNSSKEYKNANTSTSGADSDINGPQNTADMVADGNSTVYPAAHFCNDLVIGGFSDWYMPAKNELEVCYYNLKPTTTANNTGATAGGINSNAVPARTVIYTSGIPAQTSAADFKNTGAEDFLTNVYGSSTEYSALYAWGQNFGSYKQGAQYNIDKNFAASVRAIRRVAV